MKNFYFNKDKLFIKTEEDISDSILSLKLLDGDILEFYDMPILFFLTGDKNSFIVYWINSDHGFEEYLIIDSTRHQLNAYKENFIDLKTFLSGTNYFILKNDYVYKKQIISNIDVNFYTKLISEIDSGIKYKR